VADGVGEPNEDGALTVAHVWPVLAQDRRLLELASSSPGHRFEWDED
jgi:hypothetical protein